MLIRVITSVVALCVLLPFLIFSDTFMMLILACVLSVIAEYEMLGCVGWRKNGWVAIPSYLYGVIFVLLTRALHGELIFTGLFFLTFAYLFWIMCVSVWSRGSIDLVEVSVVPMTTAYITFGFASLVLLRDLPHGQYIYLLAFIIPWSCDTMAYFTGMFFGRHKLIEDVSPKKTVEGAVGGIVLGTGIVLLYGWLMGCFFPVTPNYLALAVIGVVGTIVSQFGDLIASKIKRHFGIKDYGFILPGHGGILDRFDSNIATAGFLYILCRVLPHLPIFS